VPIARYLIFVGCTLIALLLIAGWCLPTPPAMFADQQLAIDRAVIRIKSARKWPEKIVLDTSRPTMAPRAIEEPPAAQSVQRLADEPGDQSNPSGFGPAETRHKVGRSRSSDLASEAGFGKNCSTKTCGPNSRYTSASTSRSGRELLSVWVGRQWPNKLESDVAQARVVMAYGLARDHRKGLKDNRLLTSLHTKLRSWRPNGSGMNKIVRTTSATPWSSEKSNVHVKTCHRCSRSARCGPGVCA
jgi:hypothetical protein